MADTKKIFSKNKFWAIILVAQFVLFFVLSKVRFTVDFFSELFEWKKNVHNFLFSKIPFSAGDLAYTFLTVWLIFLLINIRKPKKSSIRKLLILFNIFYFIYQCFWGILYFQTPIISKLNPRKITETDLKILAEKYLTLCKETREKVSENEKGIFVIKNLPELKNEILLLQNQLDPKINSKKPIRVLSVKPSLYNYLMNFTGILGYYNPFTSEAQFNPNIPATQIPFTLAHEMSHQLGYAREQEASFSAYLIAKKSKNPDLVYSMQLYVLKSLLRNLSKNDEDFAKRILSEFSEKMKKDREYEIEFYKNHKSFLSDIFGVTNDLFLKSNQQDGQITYNYFIYLVVLYEL